MQKAEILETIQNIVRDIVDDDDVVLMPVMTAEDVDGWDSVNHIKIILGIESEFDVRFDVDQINASETVGDLVDLVAEKLN